MPMTDQDQSGTDLRLIRDQPKSNPGQIWDRCGTDPGPDPGWEFFRICWDFQFFRIFLEFFGIEYFRNFLEYFRNFLEFFGNLLG